MKNLGYETRDSFFGDKVLLGSARTPFFINLTFNSLPSVVFKIFNYNCSYGIISNDIAKSILLHRTGDISYNDF